MNSHMNTEKNRLQVNPVFHLRNKEANRWLKISDLESSAYYNYLGGRTEYTDEGGYTKQSHEETAK